MIAPSLVHVIEQPVTRHGTSRNPNDADQGNGDGDGKGEFAHWAPLFG